jgi:hypothetical protein
VYGLMQAMRNAQRRAPVRSAGVTRGPCRGTFPSDQQASTNNKTTHHIASGTDR